MNNATHPSTRLFNLWVVLILIVVTTLSFVADAALAESFVEWTTASVERDGVMTWTPTRAEPDFFNSSVSSNRRILESDIDFGSSFRTSGHDKILVYPGYAHATTFEWEFNLKAIGWANGYDTGYFVCDLPQCEADTSLDDDGTHRNYAAITGAPSLINANTQYHVDIGVIKGPTSISEVQLRSVAGAQSSSCPLSTVALCSFENYGHYYNKARQHVASSSGAYGWYNGGSYVTDNTYSPCPGSWGFTAGNVDKWCFSGSNGPEPPGRVTIRPKSGYQSGFAYRTVGFPMAPTDNFSVEYVVQCLTGSSCKGRLGWEGRGLNPTESVNGAVFTVPNDGHYYICRIDSRHNGTAQANSQHSDIRARLFNEKSGTQLRIDAMAIYGWVGYGNIFNSQSTNVDLNHCNRA